MEDKSRAAAEKTRNAINNLSGSTKENAERNRLAKKSFKEMAEPLMLEAIRQSKFTNNDATRLLVRSRETPDHPRKVPTPARYS